METNGRQIFEVLDRLGVTDLSLPVVSNWPSANLVDLIERLSEEISEARSVPQTVFSFVANGHLSGLPAPFVDQEPRVLAAEGLARFAALYADTVLIRDPFEIYLGRSVVQSPDGMHDEFPTEFPPDPWPDDLRTQILADLRILLLFRPLIEAGIVKFVRSKMHWCPICIHRRANDGGSTMALTTTENSAWQKRVAAMVEHLESRFVDDGAVMAHRHGDHSHVTMVRVERHLEFESEQSPL
jgi:hypothetical protein